MTESHSFRVNCQAIHLTYKTHIDHDYLSNFVITIANRGEPVCFSIVHESGESDEQNPYAHTHAFFAWKKRLDIKNSRVFDVIGRVNEGATEDEAGVEREELIHPHIKAVTSKKQQEAVWKYHEKAPVKLTRYGTPPGEGDGSTDYEAIRDAPSFIEACEIASVKIRTAVDVHILRTAKDISVCVPRFNPNDFIIGKLPEFRCIFVYGKSGCGKTQWALSQFKCPLVVSERDDIGAFNPRLHDGIVFDDFSISHWPRTSAIHLCDWDEERSINIRYKCARIPAGTRKIFTSNEPFEATFPADPYGAIRRRFTFFIRVDGRLMYGYRSVPSDNSSASGGVSERSESASDDMEEGRTSGEVVEFVKVGDTCREYSVLDPFHVVNLPNMLI